MVRQDAAAYSIRVVAEETGIPAETLRAWERRYGFPKPARRPGGGRLYSEDDVARLRLIARARDAGYRPSDIVALPDRDILRLLDTKVVSPVPVAPALGPDIDALVESLRREDIVGLRTTLRSLAISLRPRAFVTDVAHPFAVRIGDAWEKGAIDVRHEHLATALLSSQLRILLSAFEDSEDRPTVLLATLPGEAHALGLDMVAVYLATQRATPRMLGADTPSEQLARAARASGAEVVGVSVSLACEVAATRRDLDRLRDALDGTRTEVWVGGGGAPRVAKPDERTRIATSWADVDRALAAVRGHSPR